MVAGRVYARLYVGNMMLARGFAMELLYKYLRRFGTAPLWIAAAVIILTVIFGDLPGESLYAAVLQNACHAPAFAVLALITLALLTPGIRNAAVRAPVTVGAMLLVGAATEGVQSLFGRDAELEDVVNDVAGALGAVGLWLYLHWRGRTDARARVARIAALVLCLAAAVYWLAPLAQCARAYWDRHAEFPVLAQFKSGRDLSFISSSGGDAHIVDSALQVDLDSGRWPGVTLSEPAPDWTGYRTLAVELGNPGSVALPLRFRVNDRAHRGVTDDRFNMDVLLPPGVRTTLHIPLEDIARSPRTRRMDMSTISQLTLFRDGGAPGQVLRLYRIWLE
jgi:hypothetical protein